jgi:BlaI family penicillinase repressor
MTQESRPEISDAERDVLQSLWEHGPGTVREVKERLRSRSPAWSRSTVITLLQRLEKKGFVASDRSDFAFVFRAVVSRDELTNQRMRQLADELYEGEAAPLLLAFARQQRFTPQELKELKGLIDSLAEPRSRKKT